MDSFHHGSLSSFDVVARAKFPEEKWRRMWRLLLRRNVVIEDWEWEWEWE
jgi:hypothetical protein